MVKSMNSFILADLNYS